MRIFRVVVRGQFADLSDGQRAALSADGTLTYDEQLVAFNLRYEVRHTEPVPNDEAVGAEATDRAVATLTGMGLAAKHLRANVTDMATIWN
jgi:hypothetical protein